MTTLRWSPTKSPVVAATQSSTSRLVSQASPSIGHVNRGGFVPHVGQLDLCIQDGIEDGHDMVAGEREYPFATEAIERLGNDIGPTRFLRHFTILRFKLREQGDKPGMSRGTRSAEDVVGQEHRQ
jgi:hypothetical protein